MRIDRLHQRTVDRLQLLESQRRQTWLYPGFSPPAAALNVMWSIVGSNTIVSPATTGIRYVTANVDPTTLPVPVIVPAPSPGDIVIVDAEIPPTGLPDGIGTARALGSGDYAFVLNDPRNASNHRDAWINDKFYAVDRVTLDRVSGGVTYRYECLQLGALVP